MVSTITRKQRDALLEEAEQLHKNVPEYKRKSNLDFVLYLLVVLLVAFGIREFIAEPVRVDGDSMYPNLLSTERVLVNKLPYYARMPKRGEVVICLYPGYTEYCVKRVIGLPGEEIMVSGGQVFINGRALDESPYWRDYIFSDMPPQVVPENSMFVMGDNRNISKDSRSASVGPIPMERIIGHAVCVALPINSAREIPEVTY
ncbi:MAG: signal peptidase I [Eubacteriales bacterium]|nr:signal peptidase I [Eubacteriales bacterium]